MSDKLLLDCPVHFGNVSIGELTTRIGAKVSRDWLKLNDADLLFSNRRLTGSIVLGHQNDAAGQKQAFDDQVSGVFDVKGFRVSVDHLSAGPTFNRADIDIAEIAKFSGSGGRLRVIGTEEIPDEEKAAAEHVPGSLKADGPWRDVSLDTLFDPKQSTYKALVTAGLKTVGELADYSATEKRLRDIEGIGDHKVQVMEDRLLDFWADNPEVQEDGQDAI